MTLSVGTKLGRYEIRSQIGAGGMGEVYLARDIEHFKMDSIENTYDVNAKGDRFLVLTTEQTARSTPFTVVFNWMSDLKR